MSEPSVRRRARRGQGAALRSELLQAAMDLLAETGDEDDVSLRAVAQRVGVTVPSIYLHFADKQALLDAVCEQVFDNLHTRMRAAAADAPDPFEGLRAQGNAYVHFALEHPEHYRIVMSREPTEARTEMASGAFGYLVASVQECVELGIFEGDAVEIALALWAAAHGVAALLITKPSFPWPTDRAEFIDRVICMAGFGLAAGSRLPAERDLPLDAIRAVLDSLRPT